MIGDTDAPTAYVGDATSARQSSGDEFATPVGLSSGRCAPWIFDLDGTLVDTVYAHVFAWQRALIEARPARSTAGGSTAGSG